LKVSSIPALLVTAGCLALSACAWLSGEGSGEAVREPADKVFRNARIYTVNEAQPWAEALAIRGSDIVYVGDDEGVQALVGDQTVVEDLGGRSMLPGFIESHIHLTIGAAAISGVVVSSDDSIETVLAEVKAYAEANPDKKTIMGSAYNGLMFDERGPHKALLDEIVADRPVYLLDHTMHSVWVNSKALEMAGITSESENPSGGLYVKDENGEPTGSIQGGPAHIPVSIAVDAFTAEAIESTLPGIVERLSAFGFTSAIDMGAPVATEAAYQALYSLSSRGELPLRLSVAFMVNTPAGIESAAADLQS